MDREGSRDLMDVIGVRGMVVNELGGTRMWNMKYDMVVLI